MFHHTRALLGCRGPCSVGCALHNTLRKALNDNRTLEVDYQVFIPTLCYRSSDWRTSCCESSSSSKRI